MDCLLVTVPAAAEMCAISRSKMYQLVAAGEIPVARFGRCARIRRVDLEEWIAGKLDSGRPDPSTMFSWGTL